MVKFGGVPDKGRSRLVLSILVLAVFLLSGCDKLRQLAHQPEIVKKQQQEITRLNTKLRSLQMQLAGVQQELKSQHVDIDQKFTTFDTSLDSLATKYAVLDSDVTKHKRCIFQKDSKGVQRLDTDMGFLLVSLAGITAHHNNYKVSLNIGNPSLSEISEFTLHLKYGKGFNPSGANSYEAWQKSLKSIVEPFKEHLKPGQWNKIEVPLGELQPDDVEYITVEMMVDNIILKQQ